MKYLRRGGASSLHRGPRGAVHDLAPNLDLTIANLPGYHGEANSTTADLDQNYVPMWTNSRRSSPSTARTSASIASSSTPTAPRPSRTAAWTSDTGRSRPTTSDRSVHFPRMRELFFAKDTGTWSATATSRVCFTSTRAPQSVGNFTSELAGVEDYRFRRCSDRWSGRASSSSQGCRRRVLRAATALVFHQPLGESDRPTARFDACHHRPGVSIGLLRLLRGEERQRGERAEHARVAARQVQPASGRGRSSRRRTAGRKRDDRDVRRGAGPRRG